MGNISWTKSWSASDNGTVLGGADIQNIQNDITTVVNGGITNANINASAAIVESKLAFDTSAGHTHDGSDSRLIAASNTHYLKGCELVYATAATLTVNPGVLELNGSVYSRVASSTTMNMATGAHWVYGSEPVSGWVYIYAYNDATTSWDVKLSTQAPAYYNCDTDNTTGTLRYRDYSDVWYRCIGRCYNNEDGHITAFTVENWYHGTGKWGSWTVADKEANTMLIATPYLADTDGFASIYDADGASGITLKTDSANPPTVVRFSAAGAPKGASGMVKKGEYWQFDSDGASQTVSWLPRFD